MKENRNIKEIKKLTNIESFFLCNLLQKSKLEFFYKNFYQKIKEDSIGDWINKSIFLKIERFRFLNKFVQFYFNALKFGSGFGGGVSLGKGPGFRPSGKKKKTEKISTFDLYNKNPFLVKKSPPKKKALQNSNFHQENFFFSAIQKKSSGSILPCSLFPTGSGLLRYGFSYKIESEKSLSFFLGSKLRFHWIRVHYIGGTSQYVLDLILFFLKKRIPYRRLCSILFRDLQERDYIEGIRITYAGRLGGKTNKAIRSKKETKKIGKPSLHIFSAKIDFAQGEVQTKFGMIGIKIWIRYK